MDNAQKFAFRNVDDVEVATHCATVQFLLCVEEVRKEPKASRLP